MPEAIKQDDKGLKCPSYRISPEDPDRISSVTITSGRFRGVEVYFGAVSIDQGVLSFRVNVVKKPLRLFFYRLKTNKLFTEVTGDILTDMMLKSTTHGYDFLVG